MEALLTQVPNLLALLNVPGDPTFAPGRLFGAFFLIVFIFSSLLLFTYWISKED